MHRWFRLPVAQQLARCVFVYERDEAVRQTRNLNYNGRLSHNPTSALQTFGYAPLSSSSFCCISFAARYAPTHTHTRPFASTPYIHTHTNTQSMKKRGVRCGSTQLLRSLFNARWKSGRSAELLPHTHETHPGRLGASFHMAGYVCVRMFNARAQTTSRARHTQIGRCYKHSAVHSVRPSTSARIHNTHQCVVLLLMHMGMAWLAVYGCVCVCRVCFALLCHARCVKVQSRSQEIVSFRGRWVQLE